jgi:hypothetical protein
VKDNLAALDVQLSPSHRAELEEASKIQLGFPHEFLTDARWLVFGETFPLIDNHRASALSMTARGAPRCARL